MTAKMEPYRIPGLPDGMFYIANFITADEESSISSKLPPTRWITLRNRRLQAHPSALTPNTNTLVAGTGLAGFLQNPISARFEDLGIFSDSPHAAANHCLVNEYEPGQGILLHEDGPAYWPVTATVSLGGSVVLDVVEKNAEEDGGSGRRGQGRAWRIVQEPRSLLVTTGAAYRETLHGIAEVREDRDLGPETVANWRLLGDVRGLEDDGGVNVRTLRMSLTYRDVLKVSKAVSKIFGKTKS